MKLRRIIVLTPLALIFLIIITGFLLPEKLIIPVKGASPKNWNPDYFWNCPWCKGDLVHRGIDIIYKSGTPILSATHGFVIYKGPLGRGGNVLMVLGPKWRIHYYAHLSQFNTEEYQCVGKGDVIGYVGNTGASDLPHLHYTIITLFPCFSRWDDDRLGWQKIFFLNPHEELMKDITHN
jgi:murein DD-endopeptidase MepM/ murein hydrolase activator NlpD